MRIHLPRKVWVALLAVVVGTVVWLAAGMPGVRSEAKPPDPACSASVIDFTSNHMLGNSQPIETAAASLEQRGVMVRVRVVDAFPKGGTNAYLSGLAGTCRDWIKATKLANGTTAYGLGSRMLVITLARGQTPNIYWGDGLGASPVFNSAVAAMNKRVSQGDYTGGLSAFLLMVEPTIKAAAPADTQPAGQPSGSLNLTPVVLVLLAVFLLAAAFVATRLLSGRRKLRRKAGRLLSAAGEAVNQCRPNLGGLTSGLSNLANQGLVARWDKIHGRYQDAARDFRNLGADGTSEDYTNSVTAAEGIIREAGEFLAEVRKVVTDARRAALPPRRRPLRPLPGPSPTPEDDLR